MKKKVMLVYAGLALLGPSVVWAAPTCPTCIIGMTCKGGADKNGCCYTGCVSDGTCGGVLCITGTVLNPVTCKCEERPCDGVMCPIGTELNLLTCECDTVDCDPGQYRPLNGRCTRCPTQSGCLMVDSTGTGDIETCRVTLCTLSDASGTYTYTDGCFYSDSTISDELEPAPGIPVKPAL